MKTAKKFGRRYPWEDWLRPGRRSLLRGRDYYVQPYAMAQMTYRAGNRLGMRVTIILDGDQINLTVTEK